MGRYRCGSGSSYTTEEVRHNLNGGLFMLGLGTIMLLSGALMNGSHGTGILLIVGGIALAIGACQFVKSMVELDIVGNSFKGDLGMNTFIRDNELHRKVNALSSIVVAIAEKDEELRDLPALEMVRKTAEKRELQAKLENLQKEVKALEAQFND